LFSGSFGLLGALIIIILQRIVSKKDRTVISHLVVCLAVANMGTAVAWLLDSDHSLMCTLQAIGIQSFEIASFLWTTVIGVTIFRNRNKVKWEFNYILSHSVCWFMAFISGMIIYIAGATGQTKMGMCWIPIDREGFRWVYYFIALLSFIVLLFVYLSMWWKVFVTEQTAEEQSFLRLHEKKQKKKLQRAFFLFFLAYVLSILPQLINRTQNHFSPQNPNYSLCMLHAITAPAIGFFNMLLYSGIVYSNLNKRHISIMDHNIASLDYIDHSVTFIDNVDIHEDT